MQPGFCFANHGARVGSGTLRQHELRVLDDARLFVLFSSIGSPRLWGYALDAASAGFMEGLARPHDGRASTRLHLALEGARQTLKRRVEALIERRGLDVGVLAVSLDDSHVHVLCAGPGRAYVRRAAGSQRLSPRDDRAEGLLRAGPSWCSERLFAGDLVLGGSRAAFGDAQREDFARMLGARSALTPTEVVDQLNAPAVKAGIGVAAFALSV